MRFLALVRAEWIKTMRMVSTYIAFAAAALMVMIVHIGIYMNQADSRIVREFEKYDLDPSWIINGYGATLFAMVFSFATLMVPVTIMTFARQVAGENLRGTLRLILSRPISRFELLSAKFIVCGLYSLLLMGFFFLFSYGFGVMLFGPKKAITAGSFREMRVERLSPEYESRTSGGSEETDAQTEMEAQAQMEMIDRWRETPAGAVFQQVMRAEIEKQLLGPVALMGRLAVVWLLSVWSLVTLGAISFFYSTINKYPIGAMACTILTYFLVIIIQQMAGAEDFVPLFEEIEPYLFTTAMNFWTEGFAREIDWGEVGRQGALLGVYSVVFFTIAQIIFWRRDVTS